MKLRIPITIELGHNVRGFRMYDVHIPIPTYKSEWNFDNLSNEWSPEKWNFKISGTEWNMTSIIIEEEEENENNNKFTEKIIKRTKFDIRYSSDNKFPGIIYLEIDTSKEVIEAIIPKIVKKDDEKLKVIGNNKITAKLNNKEKIKIPLEIIENNNVSIEGNIIIGNFEAQKIIKRTYKNKTTIEENKKEKENENKGFLKLLVGRESILAEVPINKGRVLIGNIEPGSPPEAFLKVRGSKSYTLTAKTKCEDDSNESIVWIGMNNEENKLIIRYKDREFKISDLFLFKYFRIPTEEGKKLIFSDGDTIVSRVRKDYGD